MNLATLGFIASIIAIGSGAGLLMLGNPEMEIRAWSYIVIGGIGIIINGVCSYGEWRNPT